MLVLPVILEAVQSRSDKSWKVTLGTNELTPEQVSELTKSLREWMWVGMKKDEFKERDTEILKSIQSEFEFSEKPPGQRLRAVLYKLWELDQEGYKDFQLYYNFHMEKIISHFKTKFPE